MTAVKVLGVGSAQGDDQAGWQLVEMTCPHLPPGVEAIPVAEPTRLLDYLEGCRKAVVIDASRWGQPPGTITRLVWPDPSLAESSGRSSHGLGVAAVLALAHLERLPPMPRAFRYRGPGGTARRGTERRSPTSPAPPLPACAGGGDRSVLSPDSSGLRRPSARKWNA